MRARALLPWILSWIVASAVAFAGPGAGPKKNGKEGEPRKPAPVHVSFTAPPDMPSLGSELTRAAVSALEKLSINALPGPGAAEQTLSGRLEVPGPDQVRLSASFRGAAYQSEGDLEHLDEVLAELVAQVGPVLAAPEAPPAPQRPPPRVVKREPAGPRKSPSVGPASPPERPREEPGGGPAEVPAGAGKGEPPPEDPPRRAEEPPPRRPEEPIRVAVNVVGEPFGQIPPAFVGIGLTAQQTLISYLRQRLHVQAVASPLVGLVGGLTALGESQRHGARYTLMARFDALAIVSSQPAYFGAPHGGLQLTGRIHVVLLHDGKSRFDKSYALPAVPFSPADPPNVVSARAVNAAMDLISAELAARLTRDN